MVPSSVTLGQMYGGRYSAAGGPVGGVTPSAAVQAGPDVANKNAAIAWLGIGLALVLIRVAYEMGAKVD